MHLKHCSCIPVHEPHRTRKYCTLPQNLHPCLCLHVTVETGSIQVIEVKIYVDLVLTKHVHNNALTAILAELLYHKKKKWKRKEGKEEKKKHRKQCNGYSSEDNI